ncbi:anti-phage-associated DUF3780 domain-containing protein [Escherichia coli]|uniref:DUF3780 domain-containing protein n=3 Tax=Escherichia coli TaxID=562 RepID=W1F8H7_ECOLX|nr:MULTISPECIES: anti-phage-associated DUF3780 domain-containing protein [Enterobacteriaceae]EFN8429274.1 DUF3780 domain-containing protein [Escherichia coli O68]ELQ0717753.1 DUF3780 domain-containing protein [Escherichia coli O8]CDL29993.1 hypothetical protein [Escherichia coli ISC7]ANE60579.1 hypothetical protein A5956_12910 [Escherichia coli]ANQ03632.1 hypothetical protein A9C00_17235 [Escherichia coli]
MNKTVDFGAPSEFGMHHFYVEIPAAPRDAVVIYEDYGFDGEDSRRETVECRLILARELWTKIRDDVRRDFNARLKIKKQSSGTWSTGKVKLDRFLGRELCVLGWAAEHASPDECLVICQKWLALRPEERWWLYSKTAAEAGRDDQTQRGWRKALYCALSDGANIKLETKKKPKSKKLQVEDETQDLFGFMEKGEF